MSRSSWCSLLIPLALVVGVLSSTAWAGEKQPSSTAVKPNVVFLFADDLSYEALAYAGNGQVKTPNLDRLAKQGTSFSHAYNMGSFSPAVCIASRSMLVTGRSVWKAQTLHAAGGKEPKNVVLWPRQMHGAGYQTFITGKWHVPWNPMLAFDVTAHVRGGMPKDVPSFYDRPHADKPDTFDPANPGNGGYWQGGKHWSEVTADDAVEFFSASRDKSRPCFMYVAFNAPHDPRQAPQTYLDRYPTETIEVPKDFQPLYPERASIGADEKLRDEKLAPFPRTEFAVRTHRREYYALITHLDDQIGRILDAIEQTKSDRPTMVMFTADHGLACGHHGLMGKQNMYDHSIRVPLIIAGENIPQGKTIDVPVYLQDVMPTALELAGVAPGPEVYFHSLLPIVRGEQKVSNYPAIYSSYLNLQRCVVKDGFKLVVYPALPAAKLFDLQHDPLELSDLSADPNHAARKAQLFDALVAEAESISDPLDLAKARKKLFPQ